MGRSFSDKDGFNTRRIIALLILIGINAVLKVISGTLTTLEMLVLVTQIGGVVVFYELVYWILKSINIKND